MTADGDPGRIITLAVIVVLAAAMAFGVWHVVIGGWVYGNLRAAAFGVILATAAGSILSPLLVAFRRRTRA